MKNQEELLESFESVRYRIREEGIDYINERIEELLNTEEL